MKKENVKENIGLAKCVIIAEKIELKI